MKKRVVFACLLAAQSASAQSARELTLDAAVRRALAEHPALALSDATIARAQSGVKEARASQLPSLSLDANLTRFEEPMVVAPLHGLDLRNPPVFDRTLSQSTLALGYTLFDAARGARIDRAEALADAAHTTQATARMQVLSDVTRAYLRLHSARELARAHAHRITALQRERDRAAQLVEQGRAARVVLLRADAALSAARADAVAADGDAESAENELARQMNVSAGAMRGVSVQRVKPADSTTVDKATVRANALQNNPDVQRAQRQIAAAEATRAEARGLWLPRFQLGGRYIEYASTETSPQGEWQGALQLSYPIFTGGARKAAGQRADAEIRIARAEFELTARRIDDAIDRAVSALATARARVSALQAAVRQSEEVTRIDRLALDAGAGVQSEYLTAEADLLRARAALTDARAMELVAMIELARISGELSESWIAQHVEPSR